MKEYRSYWLSASDEKLCKHIPNISGYLIKDWADCPEGKNLPLSALKFIKICEEQGTVASLKGFMVAFNIEEEIGMNDYVFITNKY